MTMGKRFANFGFAEKKQEPGAGARGEERGAKKRENFGDKSNFGKFESYKKFSR